MKSGKEFTSMLNYWIVNILIYSRSNFSKCEKYKKVNNFLKDVEQILKNKEFVMDYNDSYPFVEDFEALMIYYPKMFVYYFNFVLKKSIKPWLFVLEIFPDVSWSCIRFTICILSKFGLYYLKETSPIIQ